MTDLDCKQTEKLIPQFLKDELDNRTEKKFLNHVDGCSSCLEELSIQFLVTTGMQHLLHHRNLLVQLLRHRLSRP